MRLQNRVWGEGFALDTTKEESFRANLICCLKEKLAQSFSLGSVGRTEGQAPARGSSRSAALCAELAGATGRIWEVCAVFQEAAFQAPAWWCLS